VDLREEDILGDKVDSHWYYRSKSLALLKFLRSIKSINKVLDVGAGSGIFSKQLLQSTDAEESVCVDTGYPEEKRETINGKTIEFKKGFAGSDADIVLLMDVIEHIEDDVFFVKDIADKVKPGTSFLITVPAFQFLFSGHDSFLKHCRRYNISQLESCLEKAGLKVLKSRYYFGSLFPLIALLRIIKKIKMRLKSEKFVPESDLKVHSAFTNQILFLIHKFELLVFPYNKFFGLTVFSLAVKP
jgi:SAM-dependent methyltransferase